jgi:hypothetical protein
VSERHASAWRRAFHIFYSREELFLVQVRAFVVVVFIVAFACITVAAQDSTSQQPSEPIGHAHHHGSMQDIPESTPPSEQKHDTMAGHDMQGMQHEGMNMEMSTPSFLKTIEHHGADGTSVEPNSTPMPMLIFMKGDWSLMCMGSHF